MPTMRIQNRNDSTYPTMPTPGGPNNRNQNTKELCDLFKNLDMEPNTLEDLSKRFYVWSSNQLPHPMLTNAAHLQAFILWDNFSHGFLAINWQSQQQNYYENKQL